MYMYILESIKYVTIIHFIKIYNNNIRFNRIYALDSKDHSNALLTNEITVKGAP